MRGTCRRGVLAAYLQRYNATITPRSSSFNPSSDIYFTKSTFCNGGERAIGGSGSTTSPGLAMTDSWADNGGNAWTIRWEAINGAVNPTNMTVVALCAPNL